MFQDEDLKNHLQTSYTIQTNSLVFAEWNMNQPEVIARLGNYRYRPGSSDANYATIASTYDVNDALGSVKYYTGATDADIVVDGGVDDQGDPIKFTSAKEKFKMLYSLEECIKPFRPRSGINKVVYLGISGSSYTNAQYLAAGGQNAATRPRYYVSSKYDQFKYWTSYRTENGIEYGVSRTRINGRSYIYDAAPFVVYSENVPSNRIVVKMQTNVGTTNIGDVRINDVTIPDPLYGEANKTTPVRWRIQVLKETSWVDAAVFDENSTRSDGSPIIKEDGYVEISYGLRIPDQYKDSFVYAGELSSTSSLPESAPDGYAYLVKNNSTDKGIFYIYSVALQTWQNFNPEYAWDVSEDAVDKYTKFVSDVTDPDYFWEFGKKVYREIDLVGGIRIVVETMNKENCTFDLIEMSPRLTVNLTDRVQEFSITKMISDLGAGKVPVGSLLAGTGNITINNNDSAFIDENVFNENTSTGSLVAKYLKTNIKFSFYEIVKNVNGFDYFIPLKTLYSESYPQSSANFDQISLSLRDAYFILESSPAPSLLMTDISLSNALMILLDYIGWSNYTFKRIAGQADPVIPYFFIAPNQNVAEVINQLAVATQSAMFFDEYNNFVMMTKEYMMPESGQRELNYTLYGTKTGNMLPNILEISSANKSVNNNGQINYTQRYIQRSYGSTRQASYNDEFKNWVYVPTLLWEVTGDSATKPQNDAANQQSAYALTAMPLRVDLSETVPTVVNNVMTNNVIDVGENIYYYTRYNGYLYANGEIIKYDAIEFNVTLAIWYPINSDGSLDYTKPKVVPSGSLVPVDVDPTTATSWRASHRQGSSNVWINSTDEYQSYFLQLPFNGKMYPTGRIRIWSEPEYVTVDGVTKMKEGAATSHGRGQFGTAITSHKAGLDSYWTDNQNVYGCKQESEYIYSAQQFVNYPLAPLQPNTAGGISPTKAKESVRTGIIKNTLSQVYWTEQELNQFNVAKTGTVQSSALVFTGPTFADVTTQVVGSVSNPRDYVSYIYKEANDAYRHFGTRTRIIGRIESGTNRTQTPIGSAQYIAVTPNTTEQPVTISGGSGGIGIMVNKETNNGYFFEIAALTNNEGAAYYNSANKQVVVYPVAAGKVSFSGPSNRFVTLTTSTKHTFSVGQRVVVTGFNVSSVNGEFVVTEITDTTIKYDSGIAQSTVPSSGGQVEMFVETSVNINNIIFYKVVGGPDGKAYPVKLWAGLGNILVDSGRFVGQYRTVAEENPTVYDLAVEYKDVGNTRIFYLYLNDKQIATVTDTQPLNKTNSMCLFVRGSSKLMFENVYALAENYSQNTIGTAVKNIAEAFGDDEVNSSEALRKYAVSGFVQQAYLSNISSYQPPDYRMYYDEFGTIMRECAHFNIKYDRAYPALAARLAPTLNRIKTYTSSGFYAGAYGADFLVFNSTDKVINLDATSGNFLRIQGITFTQNTTKTLTVDDYFNKISNLSDPQFDNGNLVYSPQYNKELYNKIKISRTRHGNQEFSLESPFIQSDAQAENIMGWIINKTMNPKQNVGVATFGTQLLQLGDIVNIEYVDQNNVAVVAPPTKRFVIYHIEYSRSSGELGMNLYLTEV